MINLKQLTYDELQEVKSQIKEIEKTKTRHFTVNFDIHIRMDREDWSSESDVLEETILNILDCELDLTAPERIENIVVKSAD